MKRVIAYKGVVPRRRASDRGLWRWFWDGLKDPDGPFLLRLALFVAGWYGVLFLLLRWYAGVVAGGLPG